MSRTDLFPGVFEFKVVVRKTEFCFCLFYKFFTSNRLKAKCDRVVTANPGYCRGCTAGDGTLPGVSGKLL